MSHIDPYEVLGVAKDASQNDIKKAYRQLARKYHPDVAPGDKKAEEKFKEISEAYDILGNKDKRAEYDRLGQQSFYESSFDGAGYQRPEPGAGPSFEDIFGDIFGGRTEAGGGFDFRNIFQGGQAGSTGGFYRDQSGPVRGGDQIYSLELSFQEAFNGVEKILDLERPAPCPACGGQGFESGSSEPCPACQGTGKITKQTGKTRIMSTCSACGGSGRAGGLKICRTCGGEGRVPKRETIKARIPAGVDTGSKVRLAGKGLPGLFGGPPGDLFLKIEVAPDPVFTRQGDDIFVEADVSLFDAVLGGKVEVPTPAGGRAVVTIPEGTQAGQKLRLKGQGAGKGDLYVIVKVALPKKLNPEARDLFNKLRNLAPVNPDRP